MEFDKQKYVIRGIPLIPDSKTLEDIYVAFNLKKASKSGSFRIENPHLGKVLDHRAENIEKNMRNRVWEYDFDDIVLLGERNFIVGASLVFRGLYEASEDGATLSEESGLPILTKKMGEDMVGLYRGVQMARGNSDEFLEFLKEKGRHLSDLISIMSSDYEGKPPVENREFISGDATSSAEFINRRGNFGAETLYKVLTGRNKTLRLNEQLGI